MLHEEAQRRCTGGPPQKRLRQSVLSFAPKRPSQKEVQQRIVASVCPTLASGDTEDNAVVQFHTTVVTRNNRPLFCNGIVPHKDLSDRQIQAGINYLMLYYKNKVTLNEYKCARTCDDSGTLSIFDNNCTGGSETVR